LSNLNLVQLTFKQHLLNLNDSKNIDRYLNDLAELQCEIESISPPTQPEVTPPPPPKPTKPPRPHKTPQPAKLRISKRVRGLNTSLDLQDMSVPQSLK
jgi:hypothetical protein